MNYEFFALTDVGRVRKNNEDAFSIDSANGLVVLADGMGGYNAGEIASEIATEFITTEFGRWLSRAGEKALVREVRHAMKICVDNANLAIFNSASVNSQYAGMGTTLVVGVFQGNRLILGHVGDSRCYQWRNRSLAQITRDHSLLQEQLDAGLITPEQAAASPSRNLVTRALGVEASVVLEVNEHLVIPGDIYLMCTDGLNDMVSDSAIANLFSSDVPLDALAKGLIECANANGGRDNISVLLANANQSIKRRSLMTRILGK